MPKKKNIIIVLVSLLFSFGLLGVSDSVYAGTKIFEYGFEDWTGNAETTPNYFSSNNSTTYWLDHETATEVVTSGNSNCGNRNAYSGNFYFHQNFYEGGSDPCLGTTPRSINPHTNIGFNGPIPEDPKNNFEISNEWMSDTMTVRFYFRTTDDWPNAVTNYMKFIRVYGGGNSSQILHLSDDGTTFDITDHPHPDNVNPGWADYHNIFTAPINWNDHNWHSVTMVLKRLNDINTAPNLEIKVWWDDWDMGQVADGTAETYVSDFGKSFVTLYIPQTNLYAFCQTMRSLKLFIAIIRYLLYIIRYFS